MATTARALERKAARQRAAHPRLRAKSRIGALDDPLEREADKIADAVVSDRPIGAISSAPLGTTQRKSADGKSEAHPHTGSAGEATFAVSGGGAPLTPGERAYFEPRFGRELSGVRVHTNNEAASAAHGINARTFAIGNDIAFARGEYRPDNEVGRRLIAHELAHVLQNAGGADPGVIRRGPNDEPPEFRIVSDVWSVTDENGVSRSVVIVEGGGERQVMYERSGVSERPEGHAGPKAGDWAPFDGFKDNGRGFGHFEKDLYFRGKMPTDPRYGYGDRTRIRMSEWLRDQRLPKPIPEHWTYVQSRLQEKGVHVLTPLANPVPQRPAAIEPKAQTVSGEITTRTPPPSGGGPMNEPSVVVSPEATRVRTTFEGRGALVEPIRISGGSSTQAAVEGGALALLSMQLGNVRGAEAQKAADRLAELMPQAEALQARGQGVVITLVMEVPNTIDLAAAIAGIGDASQVVYFKKMYISQITGYAAPAAPSKYPVMRENYAPGDPDQDDPHARTLDQQIRGQMGEQYPVPGSGPRRGFDFETRELRLDAARSQGAEPGFAPTYDFEAAEIRARPPPYVGTFRPDTLDQSSVGGRFSTVVAVGMHRLLKFRALPARYPGFVEMSNTHYDTYTTKYETERTSGADPSKGLSARFVEKAGGKVYTFVDSSFLYGQLPNSSEILVERASGGEANSNSENWSAVITWKRVDKLG